MCHFTNSNNTIISTIEEPINHNNNYDYGSVNIKIVSLTG
jgi:hypothetical protein